MGTLIGAIMFACGQTMAYFQTNAGVLGGWVQDNYILVATIMAPFTAVFFAIGTKYMYAELESLWSVRFITFCIGYMAFIPLTWWFLGEEILTLKNIISFSLCVILLLVQFYMK